MAREDFRFAEPLRVRWAEADMQGIVFNGHYLLYFDVAVTEYWRTLAGGDLAQLQDVIHNIYVVRAICDYHAPARFDDRLEVCVRTLQMGRSSMRLAFEIHRGSDKLVSGENVYVHAPDGASSPLPEPLRVLIRDYEKTAPIE
ncbi:MAG TPA: thioesterase family protein [Burkholderiaceae bacterium]|nr:thioesterase family protein [Burkholderiaceae bacterium]